MMTRRHFTRLLTNGAVGASLTTGAWLPASETSPGGVVPEIKLSRDEILRSLSAAFGEKIIRGRDIDTVINCGDDYYQAIAPAEVIRIASASGIYRRVYVPSLFDCEDFAFCMKAEFCHYAYRPDNGLAHGLAFGIIWGKFSWGGDSNHAANFFLTPDRQVWLIGHDSDGPKPVGDCRGQVSLIIL
jgi:hypothetical protein